jgi:hypothetical protein
MQDAILSQKRFVNCCGNHENDNPMKKLLLCENSSLLLRQYYFIYSVICLPSRHTQHGNLCSPFEFEDPVLVTVVQYTYCNRHIDLGTFRLQMKEMSSKGGGQAVNMLNMQSWGGRRIIL